MVSLVINPCFSSSCSQFTSFFEDPFCFARSHLWENKNFSLSMSIFKILGILGLLTSHSTLDHFFDGFNHVNISDWSGFLFNHQWSPSLVGGGSVMGRENFVPMLSAS